MTATTGLPRDLRIVAYLHLLLGIGAIVGFVVRAAQNHFLLPFDVLGIPICFGLLRLSRGWRSCAIVLSSFGLVLGVVAVALGLAGSSQARFGILGLVEWPVARGWLTLTAVLFALLLVWQLRVLTRPAIRALFESAASQAVPVRG